MWRVNGCWLQDASQKHSDYRMDALIFVSAAELATIYTHSQKKLSAGCEAFNALSGYVIRIKKAIAASIFPSGSEMPHLLAGWHHNASLPFFLNTLLCTPIVAANRVNQYPEDFQTKG